MRPLGPDAWVVDHGTRRRVRRIGKPHLRTHLVYDVSAARRHMHQFQKQMSSLLATEQIAWVLRELEIDVVLDVGANTGQYATQLRRAGYRGRIVSFEPLSAFAEEMRRAADADPDWHVHQVAVGDRDGTAQIHVSPSTLSSLRAPSDFGREWSSKLRETTVETVEVRRLESVFDEACNGIDRPRVYLKMDTQGFDLEAFRGAGPRIRDIVGMQSEVACLPLYEGMPRLPEQLTEYEAAGFEIAGMFPVSRHHDTMRIIEFDLVMVRADAFAGRRH